MKRLIFLSAIVFCIYSFSFGQWNWITSPTNMVMSDIWFSDETHGWIVGENGIILHTENAGDSWTEQISGTSFWLESIMFIDNQTGWAVGSQHDNGTDAVILSTTDGGINWLRQDMPGYQLSGVFFANPLYGWAVGSIGYDNGIIFHSEDGGATWTEQFVTVPDMWIDGIWFSDPYNGWAVATAGIILHTNDGGDNWHYQTSGTNWWLTDVCFSDALNGFAVGEVGTILETKDGGVSWTPRPAGTIKDLYDVHILDQANGWAVGGVFNDDGIILHTSDGGISWQEQAWTAQPNHTPRWFYGVHMNENSLGWVTGDNGAIERYKSMVIGTDDKNQSLHSFTINIHPNPVRSFATIEYFLEASAVIDLEIIDPQGKAIVKLISKRFHDKGKYLINWSSVGISPGIYICKMMVGKNTVSSKIIVSN